MTAAQPAPTRPASDADAPYEVRRTSHSHFLTLRGLRYHVRTWGEPGSISAQRPALVLLHGWMDVSASFQFMVDAFHDAFAGQRFIVAPDWRGFGLTDAGGSDTYWFPDYLGDLDALLDHLSPDLPVDLVGHSMGGNVLMLYAGVRPTRLRKLVNLEGFGMPAPPPSQAPLHLAKWLDALREPATLRRYDSLDDVAARLRQTNPRLSAQRARWLAAHWATRAEDGRWELLGDPVHKRPNAQIYRKAEALACWRRITAPMLCVVGDQSRPDLWWKGRYSLDEFHQRLRTVRRVERRLLPGAGHMLHHDEPQALAAMIESFIETDHG